MKGTSTQEDNQLKKFFINCDPEELSIIKQGLGHLQINYLSLLEEQSNTFDWYHTQYKLEQVNKVITELKTIENE